MGFGGVGLRSIGSRHLRDGAVVTRTIGSDAITTTKIAPETIIEVDIAPSAVGSSEIAANAISYIDQIKDNIIGSQHLGPDSIYSAKIQDYAVGSEHLNVGAVAYEDQIIDNLLGYSKLTTGLQGSLGGNPDILNLHFEHGRIGSITGADKSKQIIGSFSSGGVGAGWGLAFADDKNRLWETARSYNNYTFEIGTTTGNIIGSFKVMGSANFSGVFSSDNHRLWCSSLPKPYINVYYIFEYGTTNHNLIGSFKAPAINAYGITFANDKNRLWVACFGVNSYIYQVGTTTGNIIGSFVAPSTNPTGLAFASDKKCLWNVDNIKDYIFEIGTTTGNIIGSFPTPGGAGWGLSYNANNKTLWHLDNTAGYIYELGTSVERSRAGIYVNFKNAFSSEPDITFAQIGTRHVYIDEPSTDKVRFKASSFPAKVMWMAWGSR